WQTQSLIIRDIVGTSHEGIDRAHCIPLMLWQHAERVIEIFGLSFRDRITKGIRFGNGHVDIPARSLPASASINNQALRAFDTTGLPRSTSKFSAAMPFRIASPPLLNRFRVTANSLSTCLLIAPPSSSISRV